MKEQIFIEITKELKEDRDLSDEQILELIEICFDKARDKSTLVYYSQMLTRKYINAQEKLLKKYIVELENTNPPYKGKYQETMLINFLPYVRQHTLHGKTLEGHPAFTSFFNDWLPDAKKRLFEDYRWQKILDCEDFIKNLKKTIKKIKKGDE